MELRQLRYFVAVAERLSFSKAARVAHVTQPTISHQIKQLESELGYKLFERSLHHVRLTEQGEALLPGVVRALKNLDEAIQLAKTGHGPCREHLRILVGFHTISSCVLPGALGRFTARCPDVSIEIDETFPNVLMKRFEDGGYDLGIGVEEPNSPLAFRPLCQEEMILVVPPNHSMAGRKRVRVSELHGERLALFNRSFSARLVIDRCLESVGAVPRIVAEFDSPITLLRSVFAQGLGGIVSYNIPEWFNVIRPMKVHLEDPTPLRTLGLYRRRDRPLCPAAEILWEILADEIRDAGRRPNDLGLRPCSEQAA